MSLGRKLQNLQAWTWSENILICSQLLVTPAHAKVHPGFQMIENSLSILRVCLLKYHPPVTDAGTQDATPPHLILTSELTGEAQLAAR